MSIWVHDYRDDITILQHMYDNEHLRGWTKFTIAKIEGNNLLWTKPRQGHVTKHVTITPKAAKAILLEFFKLATAPDTEILRFARNWGVLGICEHGVPATHLLHPKFGKRVDFERCQPQPFKDKVFKEEVFFEPLESWREWSRKLCALDNLITDLSDQKRGNRVDWQEFSGWVECPLERDSVIAEGDKLAELVNKLLEIADLRPQFWWNAEKLVFALAHRWDYDGSLLAVLITWVALGSRFPDRFALCSSCKKPFVLGKGQSNWQSAYCDECGRKGAAREASKRYRQRQRENPSREKRKRLTEDEVREIRWTMRNEQVSPSHRFVWEEGIVRELARQYGVSIWTIYKIADGKIWKNVK